jgi:glycosyltransferase involved in cell wall biosynthesis
MNHPLAPAPRPACSTKALYLAWAVFQRRQVSMAPLVGLQCLFLPLHYKGRSHLWRALHYAALAARTLKTLWRERPDELWLQLPQLPLLWVALLYRAFSPRPLRLVADCHNAMFRPPWSTLPLARATLARCDLVVVHNEDMLGQALKLGLPAERLRVLEDVPPLRPPAPEMPPPRSLRDWPRPWVLFPGSFGEDEPVAELIEAARRLQGQASFIVTGRLSNATRNGHRLDDLPPNLRLTDYVPAAELDALLAHADLVLALTRHDGIQLSVCNEALGFGRAMVMSDTPLLSRLFGHAALAVDSSDPADLVLGIDAALSQRATLEATARRAAAERREAWLRGPWRACAERLRGRPGQPACGVQKEAA